MKKIFSKLLIILHIAALALLISSIVVFSKSLDKNPDRLTENEFEVNENIDLSNITELYNKIKEHELSNEEIYLSTMGGSITFEINKITNLNLDYSYSANVGKIYGTIGFIEDNSYLSLEEVDSSANRYAKLYDALDAIEQSYQAGLLNGLSCLSFTTVSVNDIEKDQFVYRNGILKKSEGSLTGHFYKLMYYNDINQPVYTIHISY